MTLPNLAQVSLAPHIRTPLGVVVLDVDSREYEILLNSVRATAKVKGLSIEIGTRLGGASGLIMFEYHREHSSGTHICVDPYGNLPFPTDVHGDGPFVPAGYDNAMRRQAHATLAQIAWSLNFDLMFLPLEDGEYFTRFSDGVPLYDAEKSIERLYRLVFIDGPHDLSTVLHEYDFFASRVATGGIIVFDDIGDYDHDVVHKQVLAGGFKIFERGECKAAYIKRA